MNTYAVAAAFNRWMDDYTKNPDGFAEIHKAALVHLNERLDGREPTYGEACAEMLSRYMDAPINS